MAAMAMGHFFGQVFEGCISAVDSEISKRPYHKNCSCALHRSPSRTTGPSAGIGCKKCKISYPLRQSNWRKGSLGVFASSFSDSNENLHELERRKNDVLLLKSFDLAKMEK